MPRPNSVKIPRPSIFRNPWKRRRLVAGCFPAAGRSPVGHPDAFHWERVTGWSPVGGRLAQWNAPTVRLSVCPSRAHRQIENGKGTYAKVKDRGLIYRFYRDSSPRRSGMDHTVLLANYTVYLPLPRKRSPDGATTYCSGRRPVAAYYLTSKE